mmetsp:Transcript_13972/g.20923  ORF Transcript_13972/g.20923 Transcript_13972/m.20923 type:complete len:87 (-) Transcript_13972:277-537(-)
MIFLFTSEDDKSRDSPVSSTVVPSFPISLMIKFLVKPLHFESISHVFFHRFWCTLDRGKRHEKKERNFWNLRFLRDDSFVVATRGN